MGDYERRLQDRLRRRLPATMQPGVLLVTQLDDLQALVQRKAVIDQQLLPILRPHLPDPRRYCLMVFKCEEYRDAEVQRREILEVLSHHCSYMDQLRPDVPEERTALDPERLRKILAVVWDAGLDVLGNAVVEGCGDGKEEIWLVKSLQEKGQGPGGLFLWAFDLLQTAIRAYASVVSLPADRIWRLCISPDTGFSFDAVTWQDIAGAVDAGSLELAQAQLGAMPAASGMIPIVLLAGCNNETCTQLHAHLLCLVRMAEIELLVMAQGRR